MNREVWSFESVAHITELLNDTITGIVAFLFYWPFVWLMFNSEVLSQSFPIIYIFKLSYLSLTEIGGYWIGIILAMPFIGLINRAVVYTIVDTFLLRFLFRIFILNKISSFIYKFTIKTLDRQLGRVVNVAKLENLDNLFNPCWNLEGTFDFVEYRHWLIKNQSRKVYWDWEHFLDWVYKIYYQTFVIVIIMLVALLVYIYSRFGFYSIIQHNCSSVFLIIVFLCLTYSLYREYLRHHIAWIRMNQRFYIEYLKEERKDVLKSLQDQNIKEYLLTENYEKLDSIFEEIKQQLF